MKNHTSNTAEYISMCHYRYRGYDIIWEGEEDAEWIVYDTPISWPIQSDEEVTLDNCKRYIDRNLEK